MERQVTSAFPHAVRTDELIDRITHVLEQSAHFSRETTLVATSLCSDEVNRPFEQALAEPFTGTYFAMGGLAGFPFGGVTGWEAMAHHIPKEDTKGSCLIVFGPHVGIDQNGNIGSLNRRGQSDISSACCGSARAAYANMKRMSTTSQGRSGIPPQATRRVLDPIDFEQALVINLLQPYALSLLQSTQPMIELPRCAYEAQKKMMNRIMATASPDISNSVGRIALLGGILINTIPDVPDYFLPLDFELRNGRNGIIKDLMRDLKNMTA